MQELRSIATLLVLLLFSPTAFCTHYEQPIAGPTDIGTDWVAITPPAPLKSRQLEQYVRLQVDALDESATWKHGPPGRTLAFSDGTTAEIEARLLDDQGQAYDLYVAMVWTGTAAGAYLTSPLTRSVDGRPAPAFPADRTYTKLWIRSSIPLHLTEIRWYCRTTP